MRHTVDTLRNVILSCHSIRDARNLSHECTDCCYCATGASLTAREATFGRCQGSCHPHTRYVGAPCTDARNGAALRVAFRQSAPPRGQWKSVSFSITATALANNASSTVVRVSMTPAAALDACASARAISPGTIHRCHLSRYSPAAGRCS